MKKSILFMTSFIISMGLFSQIKVLNNGRFAIGQNYIDNAYKCEINGGNLISLRLKSTSWDATSVSESTNFSAKCWVANTLGSNWFYVRHDGSFFSFKSFRLSDSSIKTNILPIHNYNLIDSIKGVYYDYKPGFNGDTTSNDLLYKHQLGFIAQNIQQHLPASVSMMDSNRLTVDYVSLIPLLVEYTKNLKIKLLVLEQQVQQCCNTNSIQGNSPTQGNSLLNDEIDYYLNKTISIIPNPNNGKFTINTDENIQTYKPYKALITDLTGKEIATFVLENDKTEINVSKYNLNGLFLVTIIDDKSEILKTQKIIIENK